MASPAHGFGSRDQSEDIDLLDQRDPARLEARVREDELVRTHLSLVGYHVNELMGRVPGHVSRDELTSAGLMALALAARSFEADRGVPFGRFAAARIRGALIDELRSLDWASRSVRSRARQREAARERLVAQLGRTPTLPELMAATGLTESELAAIDDDVQRASVLSIHGLAEAGSLEDVLPGRLPSPEHAVLSAERLGYLGDAVAELPERLRVVIERYFYEDQPMADIAAELGVTESRVSQMRSEAIGLLRDGLNSQLDPDQLSEPVRPGGCAARRKESYYAAIAARGTMRSRLERGAAVESFAFDGVA